MLFSCFVFTRIARANESVGTGLNGCGEFLQILGNVPHIVEQFVNIFRIDLERLVEPRGGVGHVRKRAAKLDNGFANVRTGLADHGIAMSERLMCFLGSFSKILEEWLQLLAEGVHVSQSCLDLGTV